MDKIRVFIGSANKFKCCESAIENSILANTSAPVEIRFIRPEDLAVPLTGCTGFTNLRYAVPELAGFAGYAIYLDVDMIVLGDIAELYSYASPGHWVCLQDGSNEVSVISCGTHRHMPRLAQMHHYGKRELEAMTRKKKAIPASWNVEDKVQAGMQLLHLTDLKCQPWLESPEYPHPCPEAVAIYEEYLNAAA